MINKMLFCASVLCATSAMAEPYLDGRCTTDLGVRMHFGIRDQTGYINYNDGEPQKIFSYVKDDLAIIVNIGNAGQMKLALNYKTGRGYFVTRKDEQKITAEGNVFCELKVIK